VDTDVIPLQLQVARRDIAYVKFVIESYEGVAVTRTLDRHAAVVVVLVAPDSLADARRIIEALQAEGACEEVDRPAGSATDWLGPEPEDEDYKTIEEAP
jgi:hypothetical protein